eukprot:4905827-Pyramimonas_sp.AAC.1
MCALCALCVARVAHCRMRCVCVSVLCCVVPRKQPPQEPSQGTVRARPQGTLPRYPTPRARAR